MNMLHEAPIPSPFQGEGQDGGEIVFHAFYPHPCPPPASGREFIFGLNC